MYLSTILKGDFVKDLIIVFPYVIKNILNTSFIESVFILRIFHVKKQQKPNLKLQINKKVNQIANRL